MSAADAAHVASGHAAALARLGNCGAQHTTEGLPWAAALSKPAMHLEVVTAGVPASAARRFKGVCDVPFEPARVFAALLDEVARARWDRNVKSTHKTELQVAPFRAALWFSTTRDGVLMGLVSSRTFIDVAVQLEFPDAPSPAAGPDGFSAAAGSFLTGGHGLLADARYPEAPGLIRGLNHGGTGFVIEARPGGASRVHYVIQTDLKGWLPMSVINFNIVRSFVDFFGDLLAELEASADIGDARSTIASESSEISLASMASGR